jgi:hypothetical protein
MDETDARTHSDADDMHDAFDACLLFVYSFLHTTKMTTPTASTLFPPKLMTLNPDSSDALEVSVHTLPKPLLREFRHVFADKYLMMNEGTTVEGLVLLAIPTNQCAREDLVAIGDHIEAEKDRLLNVVSASAGPAKWRVNVTLSFSFLR